MKVYISTKDLEGDSATGYKVQVTYTFTSFDYNEIKKIRKEIKENISDYIEIIKHDND